MNTMKKFTIAITFLSLLLVSPLAVQSRPPTSDVDCTKMAQNAIYTQLWDLCEAVQTEGAYKKLQDRYGLEGKILGAATYVAKKQYSEAEKKLRDMDIKMTELTWYCPTQTKIDCEVGAHIQSHLTDSILALDAL